jgi:hypothetical protein
MDEYTENPREKVRNLMRAGWTGNGKNVGEKVRL